jgi:hypothetical protein
VISSLHPFPGGWLHLEEEAEVDQGLQ